MSIILKNIRKSYGEPAELVLSDVSFEFKSGITCIMGQSGIGKTTLVNIIAGFVKPESGEISGLDGKKISMVFQEDRLLDWETALTNVLFVTRGAGRGGVLSSFAVHAPCSAGGTENHRANALRGLSNRSTLTTPRLARRRAIELLTQAGLEDSIHKKASELSGGMKRRVCLCRALIAEYDILILDEPFKGLDSETKPAVMQMVLDNVPKDKIVICITHDPAEAEFLGGEMAIL
jgi:NitT/TauT family transport system ATP-binding protein